MDLIKKPPYNGNWSYNVLTYPTAAITNEEYNRKLKNASDSFDEDGFMKKTILISGENLNYILDDLEEQLKDEKLPESNRQSIESMLETFSAAKGSMEYIYIIHFGLPFTEDKDIAYSNMMKVRNGYEKVLNSMGIGTVLIKDESDILQIIDGILTGEMYFGARLNGGRLIPVQKSDRDINVKDQPIALLACADDIESDPSGHFITINGRTIASSILVGKTNKNVSYQRGYKQDINIWSVDELINIAKKDNTAVIWCHVEIPISDSKLDQMIGERITKAEQTKIKDNSNDMNSNNVSINKQAEKELDKNIQAIVRGERYVYFALVGIVVGKNLNDVNAVLNEIQAKLKTGGIKSVRPRRGHLYALRMCLPTNYIKTDFLQKVKISTCVSLLPLRNNCALDEKEGPIVCRDALTKMPIRIRPSLQSPDNTLMITPTGNGKTAFACAWANRVIDYGDNAYMIMPKNENRNKGNSKGTDYKTFCEVKGGELVDFSNDTLIPGLLVIPFDKKLFGNKKWAYQMAADLHYDYVEWAIGAWLGKELTPGQKVSQSTRLKQLYQERGIIDGAGKVTNIEDWDNPKKITWPSYPDIRNLLYATRNQKTGIIPNSSDRSLWEATAKVGEGMSYYRYLGSNRRIQTEKNLVVFDLSGLPKNLSDAYCIYLMEYINLAYLPKDPDQPSKRTYVFWDEIHDMMENDITAAGIEHGARKGRAELVTSVFSTQDTVLPDNKFKTLKANCRNKILFCNLDDTNVDDVMAAFNIDQRHREGLKKTGYEIGYLLRDGYTREVNLTLTKFEKKYLFGDENTEEITVCKPATYSGLAVDDPVKDLFEVEGFFTEDDVISGIQDDYENEGYKWYNLQNPFGQGSVNCWILKSCIKLRDKPENQDIIGPIGQKGVEGHIHYGAGCMIYGWMKRHSYAFPNLRLNHTDLADITWGEVDEDGILIDPENSGCIEIEILGSHGLKDWNGKVNRAQASGYKHIIFTGDSVVCREMKTAKPPVDADYINKVKPYVTPQGKQLLRRLEEIVTAYANRKPVNPTRLEAVTELTEELEAYV